MADDEYRVRLDSFEGPLDLLLYLVQKEEVDVHDIPVSRILEKYLEALRAAETLDLERAGEFLVMASTLLSLKSAMLLPGGVDDIGEVVDPRDDLVKQLIEYRRVKESGQALRSLQEEASLRWPRGRSPEPELPAEDAPGPPGVREATLYDVFAAFHRLLRETRADEPRRIVYDDVPMEEHVARILGTLGSAGGRAGLLALLVARRDRAFVLGTFLAVLELMKEGRLLARQEGEEIEAVLPDSDAGRALKEAAAARARRLEEETPSERPKRRPPWKKASPEAGGGGEPGAGSAPPLAGAGPPSEEE